MKNSGPIIFFFTLITLYFLQGSLYSSGSMVSQGALVLLIIFNSYYLIKVISLKNNPSFIKWWSIFIVFMVCGFILTDEYSNPLFVIQLKNIMFFMTSFYPIYYWTSNQLLTSNHLRIFLIIIWPVFIISFITSQVGLQMIQNRENVVNNSSYMFVSLLPFLFLINKRIIVLSIIFLTFIFLVIGSKRGAVVNGGIIALIVIFFNLKNNQGNNFFAKFGSTVLIVIFVCMVIYYFSYKFESNSYIFDRFEKEDSRRPENYKALINHYYNSTTYIDLLFGYGYFSTPLYNPERVMAHNDWIEMLNDFGLVGVLLYAIKYFSFAKVFLKLEDIKHKYMSFSILICWLLISSYSMWMNNYINIIYAILIGYVVGQLKKNNKKI